jgi:hypothetical protein
MLAVEDVERRIAWGTPWEGFCCSTRGCAPTSCVRPHQFYHKIPDNVTYSYGLSHILQILHRRRTCRDGEVLSPGGRVTVYCQFCHPLATRLVLVGTSLFTSTLLLFLLLLSLIDTV